MIIDFLTHESGKLNLGDSFISLRLIKETLRKQNKIAVMEETSNFLECRVFRIFRLFGGPWMGPYPVLCLRIERQGQSTILHYDFFWPEYYLVGIGSIVLGVATGAYYQYASYIFRIKTGLMAFIVCLIFAGFFTFMDVKYFSRKVRNSLKDI